MTATNPRRVASARPYVYGVGTGKPVRGRLAYLQAGMPLDFEQPLKGRIGLLIGAFAAGMSCALLTGFLTDHSRIKQDTVMGIVFSGMFALGLVMYVAIQTEVHLDHILFFHPPMHTAPWYFASMWSPYLGYNLFGITLFI